MRINNNNKYVHIQTTNKAKPNALPNLSYNFDRLFLCIADLWQSLQNSLPA